MKKKEIKHYLNKHIRFIDKRIEFLSSWMASEEPDEREILKDIILYLTGNTESLLTIKHDLAVMSVLGELKDIFSTWDILEDGDFLGYIYQGLQSSGSRKNKGQFFTPQDIVEYLVSMGIGDDVSIGSFRLMDPSCGSGQFLLSAFRHLIEVYKAKGYGFEAAASSIVKNNLFGADIDYTATIIARHNLSLVSGCSTGEIRIYNTDFLYRDDLRFSEEALEHRTYDLIIGNPPWGSRIEKEQKSYYRKRYSSSKSGINTFSLFIERAFDFIKADGTIAYLIPQAYLNIKAHRSSREMVLYSSCIRDIRVWGEKFKGVFAPSVSLMLDIEENPEKRNRNIISIVPEKNIEKETKNLVPQASFLRTPENIFNVNYSRKASNIISVIEGNDSLYLKGMSRFFLGVVTGNNSRHIASERSELYPDPIIVGKDISQYRIDFSEHYFKFNPDLLQQVAPEHLYRTGNKILYKFIGKKLTFALDREGVYSLNNVNGFIPEFSSINVETALSILNSNLMQYYYQKNFFTVKVLRGNLERLPIKIMGTDNQEKLRNLASIVMNEGNAANSVYRENIEDIIYHEYGITDRDAYLINDIVSS